MGKINEIYRDIILETEVMKVQREKVDKYIDDILREQKEKMGKNGYEMYRDKFYQVAMMAEEEGFVLGFWYATQLMAECLGKSTVRPE